MRFRDIYLPTDVDNVENKETNNDVLDLGSFRELDFAEQYLDTDGILHIKTFFRRTVARFQPQHKKRRHLR